MIFEYQHTVNVADYIPVTRVGLSALVGCSRESIMNILSQFHEDGILEVKGRHIKILKPYSLNLILKNG